MLEIICKIAARAAILLYVCMLYQCVQVVPAVPVGDF